MRGPTVCEKSERRTDVLIRTVHDCIVHASFRLADLFVEHWKYAHVRGGCNKRHDIVGQNLWIVLLYLFADIGDELRVYGRPMPRRTEGIVDESFIKFLVHDVVLFGAPSSSPEESLVRSFFFCVTKQYIQTMALARISKWLCGGVDDDDGGALKTDSKLTTENRLKVDPVKTENKLKIEKTSVDVNVNAPKKVKIEGPDAVTVKHEVDVLGPAFSTLSKPVVAVRNKFSKTQTTPEPSAPSSTSAPTVRMSSNTSVSQVATKRSATIGSRVSSDESLTQST